jgi:Tfp pilus assembly protein FimT
VRNTLLAEIDENLIRNALTELEQCLALARRKEIYEARWPETRAKVSGARASNKKQGKTHDASEIISFADDTAAKTTPTEEESFRQLVLSNKQSFRCCCG